MTTAPRYCRACGAEQLTTDSFCANCGIPVPPPTAQLAVASAPAAALPVVSEGSQPLLQFNHDYPESLSRWKIFVKWILAIPHLFILWVLQLGVGLSVMIGWVMILFTGNYPRGLWDFNLMVMRWSANVNTYVMLQTDEYPPFGEGSYPAYLDLAYPESLSRWKIFLKWLLILPNAFVLTFVILAQWVVVIFAFFAILITGNFPKGAFDFVTGAQRWNYRVQAYTNLMTDKYPPFSLD